jgi:TatD DNase family protein
VLTDTHCHLDADAFDADRSAVIQRAVDAGIVRMLAPGLDVASSERCIQAADEHACVFAAAGIHPTEAGSFDEPALNRLRSLAQHPKVVAIGEIGLDYYWVKEPALQAHQREVLASQLQLASELHKPVVLHARERGDADNGPCLADLLNLLEGWLSSGGPTWPPGVLHSFSGTIEIARRAIELGFYIGITGPVTYKNAAARREVVAALPLDRILIETDSPYLAPHPYRGQRNEPAYVAHIADKIATVKSTTTEEVTVVTGENAARLFSWGDIS